MQILFEYATLDGALRGKVGTVEALENSWNLLRSTREIQGYLSQRSLDSLFQSLIQSKSTVVAERIREQLKLVFRICPVNDSTLIRASSSHIRNFDCAVDVVCATTMRLQAILTQQPEQFEGAGLSVVPVQSMSQSQLSLQLTQHTNSPILLIGSLLDLPRINAALIVPNLKRVSADRRINLSQWLQHIYDQDWQPVEELLLSNQQAFSFRRAQPQHTARGKCLNLIRNSNYRIALIVCAERILQTEISVQISLCAIGNNVELPVTLKIQLLDESGNPEPGQKASSTSGQERITLSVAGEKGEKFGVEVTLGNIRLIESFVI